MKKMIDEMVKYERFWEDDFNYFRGHRIEFEFEGENYVLRRIMAAEHEYVWALGSSDYNISITDKSIKGTFYWIFR